MNTLHILNGESTLYQMQQANGIEGQKVVWPDVLTEGPVHPQVGSQAYHKLRKGFLVSEYQTTANTYNQKAAPFFDALNRSQSFHEVVLWFEYDLFCQVNMLAVLAALHQRGYSHQVSLICIGHVPGHARLVGLGEVNPNLYSSFYANRTQLSPAPVAQAAHLWQLYCQPNAVAFVQAAQQAAPVFKYLPAAIAAHIQRFPSQLNGLNEIEQYIVGMVHSQPRSQKQIVRALLLRADYYGFGDLQYFNLLEQLNDLFTVQDNTYTLNQTGLAVHHCQTNYLTINTQPVLLGGATHFNFRWAQPQTVLKAIKIK